MLKLNFSFKEIDLVANNVLLKKKNIIPTHDSPNSGISRYLIVPWDIIFK